MLFAVIMLKIQIRKTSDMIKPRGSASSYTKPTHEYEERLGTRSSLPGFLVVPQGNNATGRLNHPYTSKKSQSENSLLNYAITWNLGVGNIENLVASSLCSHEREGRLGTRPIICTSGPILLLVAAREQCDLAPKPPVNLVKVLARKLALESRNPLES